MIRAHQFERVAVVAEQAALGGDPEESVAVLGQRLHAEIREALGEAVNLETRVLRGERKPDRHDERPGPSATFHMSYIGNRMSTLNRSSPSDRM